jgi:phospholipid/cholesterol/gamma-HCH transport system substrate-binding protein/paraquat-inducible protein B
MSTEANYFKVGIFVLAACAVCIAGIVYLGAGEILKDQILLETYIDESVQGLEIGSPIKYRGVQIGKVSRIGLTRTRYEQNTPFEERRRYVMIEAQVEADQFGARDPAEIRRRIESAVERGLRMRLNSQGLTGLSYIEMDYVDDPSLYAPLPVDWTPVGYYVPSAPGIVATVTDTIESVNRALRKLEGRELGRIAENLDELLVVVTSLLRDDDTNELRRQATQLLAEARQTNESIRELLNRPGLRVILDQTESTVAVLRRVAENSEDDVTAALADFRESTAKLREMSEILPGTLEELNANLEQLASLVGDQQRSLAATIRNVESITANLDELTESAKRYPVQTLFGKPPPPPEAMK